MSRKRPFDIGIGQEGDSQIVTVAVTVGGGGGVLNWRETLVEFCDDAPLTLGGSPVHGVREVVGKAVEQSDSMMESMDSSKRNIQGGSIL